MNKKKVYKFYSILILLPHYGLTILVDFDVDYISYSKFKSIMFGIEFTVQVRPRVTIIRNQVGPYFILNNNYYPCPVVV